MSRRGNRHDNAFAESFFQLLKRERIRRKTYATRAEARQDVFDYIEMFYYPKRRHSANNRLPPVEYENRTSRGSRVSRISGAIQQEASYQVDPVRR
jgi:putative transposase